MSYISLYIYYYTDRLSIWLSVDPLADKYPNISSYTYCADNPVMLVDPNDNEIEPPTWWTNGVAKRNRLNNKEKDIIRFDVRFYKANDIRKNAEAAFAMTEATFGKQGKRDKSDAFRHAFWQTINVQDVGESFTRKCSDAHEYGTHTDGIATEIIKNPNNQKTRDYE